jgi:hypothetical protein
VEEIKAAWLRNRSEAAIRIAGSCLADRIGKLDIRPRNQQETGPYVNLAAEAQEIIQIDKTNR